MTKKRLKQNCVRELVALGTVRTSFAPCEWFGVVCILWIWPRSCNWSFCSCVQL